MKSQLSLLVWAWLVPVLSFSQTPVKDQWFETGNASKNAELFSISFPTASIGYAVGSGGAILKTINGGVSWTAISVGAGYDLIKVIFLDENTGFIAGNNAHEYGKVLRTLDGGETWAEVLHSPGGLNNMFFLNSTNGWIVGYEYLQYTKDGGNTWTNHELSGFNDLLSIVFVSPTIGFMTPNNASIGLQITRDGGLTWNPTFNQYTNELDYTDLNTIYTLKSNSPGQVFKSTDQGVNWTEKSSGLSGSLKGINFVSQNLGFVWSRDPHFGRIFRTVNAGQQWDKVYDNPQVDVNQVVAAPGGKLFAACTGGNILSSMDGSQWAVVHSGPIKGTLRRVAFMNDLNGFAVGNNGSAVKTTDGGINWIPVDVGTSNNLSGLEFVDEKKGFICGDASTFMRTGNAGENWSMASTGLDASEIRQIAAYDDNTVYLGSNNGIFITRNGGNTWTQSTYTSMCYTLFILGSDTVLSSEFAKLKYSYDGGISWSQQDLPRTFFSMYFFTAKNGIIGDSWGRVHQSSDGFLNREQRHNCNQAINDIKFVNDTIGYFVADNGYIGKTVDGGMTWIQVESGTNRHLKSICFTPEGTGFIVGKDGMILRKAAVETFTLNFSVKDEGAHPINDAIVTLNNATYPAGVYSIPGLIQGTYNFKVSRIGFVSETGSITIQKDESVTVTLKEGMDAPLAVAATSITGSSFTANWQEVGAADYYLLFVSSDHFNTHITGFEGKMVTGLSHEVNGLQQGVNYSYRLKAVSAFSESDYSNSIDVPQPSSIESLIENSTILYPNPATDRIRIEMGTQELIKVEMFDSMGRLVKIWSQPSKESGVYDFDVSQVPDGYYRFKIFLTQAIVHKGLIIR